MKFPPKTGQRVKVDFMVIHKCGIGRETGRNWNMRPGWQWNR